MFRVPDAHHCRIIYRTPKQTLHENQETVIIHYEMTSLKRKLCHSEYIELISTAVTNITNVRMVRNSSPGRGME
jgi:hypothetical protein